MNGVRKIGLWILGILLCKAFLSLKEKCLQEFFFFKKELHFIGPKVSYPSIYSIVLALSINRPMFFTCNIQPPPSPRLSHPKKIKKGRESGVVTDPSLLNQCTII